MQQVCTWQILSRGHENLVNLRLRMQHVDRTTTNARWARKTYRWRMPDPPALQTQKHGGKAWVHWEPT